jgi:hypothetical protein
MKCKKGFLLGEYTLKIIIAVLAISLLVYLLFMVYKSYSEKDDLEKAEALLETLNEKMALAKSNGVQEMVLLEPNKWVLVSFEKSMEKPKQCYDHCVCVCDFQISKKEVTLCNNAGACKNFEDAIDMKNYQIRTNSWWGKDPVTDITIEFTGGKFVINKK